MNVTSARIYQFYEPELRLSVFAANMSLEPSSQARLAARREIGTILMSLRVLVCGGRMYADRERIFQVLSDLHRARGIEVILHGAASGVDLLSVVWADKNGLRAVPFPADWARDGKLASQKRNRKIISQGRPHLLLAFPGGKGTAEMIRFAKAEGVQVVDVD